MSVEGHRWAIEDSFETAKNELGLDHNKTRSRHGWHRHVSLVMLAFAMMAVIGPTQGHCQKNATAASTKASFLIRWSIREIRRLAMKLSQRHIPHAHILAWSSWRRLIMPMRAKPTSKKLATVMLVRISALIPSACAGDGGRPGCVRGSRRSGFLTFAWGAHTCQRRVQNSEKISRDSRIAGLRTLGDRYGGDRKL